MIVLCTMKVAPALSVCVIHAFLLPDVTRYQWREINASDAPSVLDYREFPFPDLAVLLLHYR